MLCISDDDKIKSVIAINYQGKIEKTLQFSNYDFKPDSTVRQTITDYLAKHKNWIWVESTELTNGSEVNINGSAAYINLDFVEDIHKTKDEASWVLTMGLAHYKFLLKTTDDKALRDYLGHAF